MVNGLLMFFCQFREVSFPSKRCVKNVTTTGPVLSVR